jgi:hypothetical protein
MRFVEIDGSSAAHGSLLILPLALPLDTGQWLDVPVALANPSRQQMSGIRRRIASNTRNPLRNPIDREYRKTISSFSWNI